MKPINASIIKFEPKYSDLNKITLTYNSIYAYNSDFTYNNLPLYRYYSSPLGGNITKIKPTIYHTNQIKPIGGSTL